MNYVLTSCHCIRFDPIPVKAVHANLLWVIMSKSHENTSKYVDTVIFFINLNKKGQ